MPTTRTVSGSGSGSLYSGMILVWSGSVETIPSGFALCNGTNGTPDLRNKFLVGAESTSQVGLTGGNGTMTLNSSNLPSHSHSASSSFVGDALPGHVHGITDSGHSHNIVLQLYSFGGKAWCVDDTALVSDCVPAGGEDSTSSSTTSISLQSSSAGTPTGSVSTTIQSTGSGTPFSILPPYYTLAYIMKL